MSGKTPSNIRQFIAQLQDLVQYVQTVEESRHGEAVSRVGAESLARAEKERAQELERQLSVLHSRLVVFEEEKRRAVSQAQQLARQLEVVQASLTQAEAQGSATRAERDRLKAELADVAGLKLIGEKQFAEVLASQQRQIQVAVARYSKDREEAAQRQDRMRRDLQEALREVQELRELKDKLLTETQREAQAREHLEKHVDDLEKKLHQAQAERSHATQLARQSNADAFEARDRAELLERRVRTLENLVGNA